MVPRVPSLLYLGGPTPTSAAPGGQALSSSPRAESDPLQGVIMGGRTCKRLKTCLMRYVVGIIPHMTAVLINGSYQGPGASWADRSPTLQDPHGCTQLLWGWEGPQHGPTVCLPTLGCVYEVVSSPPSTLRPGPRTPIKRPSTWHTSAIHLPGLSHLLSSPTATGHTWASPAWPYSWRQALPLTCPLPLSLHSVRRMFFSDLDHFSWEEA